MLNLLAWVFYIVGIALVLGSWFNFVSPEVGWIGWILGMMGWGAQFLPGAKKQSLANEIQKLQNLREQGALTDEEFEEQKQRLLRHG